MLLSTRVLTGYIPQKVSFYYEQELKEICPKSFIPGKRQDKSESVPC